MLVTKCCTIFLASFKTCIGECGYVHVSAAAINARGGRGIYWTGVPGSKELPRILTGNLTEVLCMVVCTLIC